MTPSSSAATYRTGHSTFLRTDGWAVLIDVPPGHPLVALCWEQVVGGSELDDVLELIVEAQPSGAFAVVCETGERRVVARGAVAVILDASGTISSRSAGTGVELPLADVSSVSVSLSSDDPGGPTLPLGDGVTAASGFRVVLGATEARTADPPTRTARVDEDEAGTATVAVRPPAQRASSSEDTLPTAFTGGRAPAEKPPPAVRDPPRRRPTQPGGDSPETPRVLAARCPVGHLTSAYSDLCRVCRRAVAEQEVFETPRPVLGRLLLPHDGSVLLDRGAVLGRAPYVPADWVGARPRLVPVSDPDQDVSAQHICVVLDLWNVLVRDLGSTNGSSLLDQDGRTTRLRPHQPLPLRPGGAIVLAGVSIVRFEALP